MAGPRHSGRCHQGRASQRSWRCGWSFSPPPQSVQHLFAHRGQREIHTDLGNRQLLRWRFWLYNRLCSRKHIKRQYKNTQFNWSSIKDTFKRDAHNWLGGKLCNSLKRYISRTLDAMKQEVIVNIKKWYGEIVMRAKRKRKERKKDRPGKRRCTNAETSWTDQFCF